MPRGSLVFSVVNLVFVLVVLSISLCKCRFLDLYLVFLRFTSFGKSVGNVVFLFLVCSLSYLLHYTRAKGSHRLCFVFSRSPFRTVFRCYSICLCVWATCVNMLSSKSTKRGFGSCPQCGHSLILYSREASKLRGMWLWSWRNKPAGSQETKAELSKRRFVRGFVSLFL